MMGHNLYCDPSLEPSQRDGSNDGSQYSETVLMMGHNIGLNRVIWKIIPKLYFLPLLIRSTTV